MEDSQTNQSIGNNITNLSLTELRARWAKLWDMQPHARIGRKMLEKSLEFKIRERNGQGLSAEQQARLDQLVRQYKRNPKCFDENQPEIKPGTKIVRSYKGVQHSVLVQSSGYKYKDKNYTSLSQIATEITGVRRNGWEFFNLRREEKKP